MLGVYVALELGGNGYVPQYNLYREHLTKNVKKRHKDFVLFVYWNLSNSV